MGTDLHFDSALCDLVNEIYDWNSVSRTCFEHAGFRVLEKTEKGNRFYMNL